MKGARTSSESSGKKKIREIEPPVCLGDLFAENDEENDTEAFSQMYEVQELDIGGTVFRIRQFAWHGANANKVWPGTFNLGEYIRINKDVYGPYPILELGAATGALSIYLSAAPFLFNICTSDINDGGEVEENIYHNFALNGLTRVPHIPHTWGTGWGKSVSETEQSMDGSNILPRFQYVFASDILLYVSAYPALVQTLCEIFGIVHPPKGHDSDSDSPSSIAERARVVKGGIEGVLNKKNTDTMAVISRESDVSVCDGDVHDVVTEPWIGSDGQGMEGEGLVVADLIAVGIISRLDAGPADSHSCTGSHSGTGQFDESGLPDIPCAAAVEYTGVTATDAADVCTSGGEFTDVESHAYQLAEEDDEDAVADAEVVEVEVDVVDVEVVEVEVEGVCVGTLLAQVDDSTVEVHDNRMLDKERGQGQGQVQVQVQGGLEARSTQWPIEFVMSWNRRIAESAIFFDLMLKAGFSCEHKGKCVYSFTVNTVHRL